MNSDISQPVMSLEKFKASIDQLPSREAAAWRERFINRFVDATMPFYKKNIESLQLHVDGWCYEGYLWDCLRNHAVVSRSVFEALLLKKQKSLFVMWDIHSRDKVRIPNYWKFDKASVLKASPEVLVQNMVYLPEDVYVFDDELAEALATTHESAPDGGQLCVRACSGCSGPAAC